MMLGEEEQEVSRCPGGGKQWIGCGEVEIQTEEWN